MAYDQEVGPILVASREFPTAWKGALEEIPADFKELARFGMGAVAVSVAVPQEIGLFASPDDMPRHVLHPDLASFVNNRWSTLSESDQTEVEAGMTVLTGLRGIQTVLGYEQTRRQDSVRVRNGVYVAELWLPTSARRAVRRELGLTAESIREISMIDIRWSMDYQKRGVVIDVGIGPEAEEGDRNYYRMGLDYERQKLGVMAKAARGRRLDDIEFPFDAASRMGHALVAAVEH